MSAPLATASSMACSARARLPARSPTTGASWRQTTVVMDTRRSYGLGRPAAGRLRERRADPGPPARVEIAHHGLHVRGQNLVGVLLEAAHGELVDQRADRGRQLADGEQPLA